MPVCSQNGTAWTTLDTQTGQVFASRLQSMQYNITNSTAYQYYRLNITANNGGSGYGIQLSEMSFTYIAGTLPTAPTGLTVTPANNQVILSWTPGVGADSYNVKRTTVNGGPYTNTATGLTSLAFTNTGLANGTIYYFVVSATNQFGESTNSSQASARPVSSAAPLVNFQTGGGQVQLSWPMDHTGWQLQAQTNSTLAGLGTNWVTMSGSAVTNQISVPVNNTNGSVFFRLIYSGN